MRITLASTPPTKSQDSPPYEAQPALLLAQPGACWAQEESLQMKELRQQLLCRQQEVHDHCAGQAEMKAEMGLQQSNIN